MTAPEGSVMDTMVLLNVLLMCAWPCATFFFSLRRTLVRAAAWRVLGGHWLLLRCESSSSRRPVPGWPAGYFLTSSCRRPPCGGPCGCARWCGCAGRARADHGGADALVAADLDLAPDVGGDLAAQVALDLVVTLDVVAQRDQVVVREVLDADLRSDAGRGDELLRAGPADAEDVVRPDLDPLVAGQIDADESSHGRPFPSWCPAGVGPHRSRPPGRVPACRPGVAPRAVRDGCSCGVVLALPLLVAGVLRRSRGRRRGDGSPCTCRRSA